MASGMAVSVGITKVLSGTQVRTLWKPEEVKEHRKVVLFLLS